MKTIESKIMTEKIATSPNQTSNYHLTPPYYFAVSEEVEKNCPCELDGKKIEAKDFLPTCSNFSDTGADLRIAETHVYTLPGNIQVKGIELFPGRYFKINLGVRVLSPEGWGLKIRPRSSTVIKKNMCPLYGTIDQDFSGYLCFVGFFAPDTGKVYRAGERFILNFSERIAQIMPEQKWTFDLNHISNEEIEKKFKERNSNRGDCGYGSTGRV